ncbi:PH domain-containing protein [Nocardioides yefusunii]|uniref:PH domain-containing protein n=1 Tax=Nocardioides yefusunii TaxID=2500546 RepID=A0ABW1QZ08_9ACTN|nr:PH domain-containing protein [Nocardioides yefusunii]
MAIPAKYLNQGETVLVSTRTHVKALFRPVLILVLLIAVAVAALVFSPDGTTGTVTNGVVGVVFLVAFVWWVLRPFVAWLTTTYTFTNRRFITRTGFIATEGRSIPLNRISGIDFEIDLTDRLFGCGTLVVTDASVGGAERVHDIPDVEAVHLLVAEELHRMGGFADQRGRGDDGA